MVYSVGYRVQQIEVIEIFSSELVVSRVNVYRMSTFSLIKQIFSQYMMWFNLFKRGYFWSSGTRGGISLSPLISENIKAMTTRPKGQVVRPESFPWGPQNQLLMSYDVIKTITIGQEVIKINKSTRKRSKKCKIYFKKVTIFH